VPPLILGGVVASLIDYAVLALVIERPSYGYELYERFERRFGEFLPTSQTNVYEALNRLEREGYVQIAGLGGSRGRPRVNRSATDEGLTTYRLWLGEHLRDDPQRLELLSRLASAGLRDLEGMNEMLDRYEEESAREARQIAIPKPDPALTDPMGELLWELLVEQRRRVAAAQLEWVAYARSRVRARAEGGSVVEGVG
jgi:DNA-binding PadR family transcriptional regulator